MGRSSHVLCRRCRKRPAHRNLHHQFCEPCWRDVSGRKRPPRDSKAT